MLGCANNWDACSRRWTSRGRSNNSELGLTLCPLDPLSPLERAVDPERAVSEEEILVIVSAILGAMLLAAPPGVDLSPFDLDAWTYPGTEPYSMAKGASSTGPTR